MNKSTKIYRMSSSWFLTMVLICGIILHQVKGYIKTDSKLRHNKYYKIQVAVITQQ